MNASKIIGAVLVAGMLSGCSIMGKEYAVYFDSGSTKISKSEREKIKKVVEIAKEDDKKIKIIGYTDNAGSKDLNMKLSKKRIDMVSKELVQKGVDPMKLTTIARGEGLIDKEGSDNRDMRRVEIRVY